MISRMAEQQDDRIKKSLYYSILDGSFWSVMFGFGEKYLSAFAVFLKASNAQLAMLTSLPLLVGSVLQLFSVRLIDFFKTKRRFVVVTCIVQAFVWIPILLAFFMGKMSVYFLILFSVVYWVSGMISAPAWNSWIGDLVEPNIRGTYFAKRNKIIGLVVLVSMVLGGVILDLFKDGTNWQYLGFVLIFMIALFARLVSAVFLNKQHEPAVEIREEDKFSFVDFVKKMRFRNYGMFVIFLTFMNFSVYISAPFFVAYMLYDLKLSYINYMIIISVAFVSRYISLPVWGSLSDSYGTKKILVLTSPLICILPVLWTFSTNIYYLIAVELYGGVVWAGFELSSFNFVLDTTTPQKRARCVSYYNVLNGIMVFLGAALGGLIVKYNQVFWTKYYLVFIVSGISRSVISLLLLPRLKEARKVAEISYDKIFFKSMSMMLANGFRGAAHLLFYPHRFKRRK